jgi:hypothetical protein
MCNILNMCIVGLVNTGPGTFDLQTIDFTVKSANIRSLKSLRRRNPNIHLNEAITGV